MVTATSSVTGALVCEATVSPPGWKLRAGVPVSGPVGRRWVIPVLVSVHSAGLFRMKHTVKGNTVFIPFLHSMYFFSWDSVNVPSAWKNANMYLRQYIKRSYVHFTSPASLYQYHSLASGFNSH